MSAITKILETYKAYPLTDQTRPILKAVEDIEDLSFKINVYLKVITEREMKQADLEKLIAVHQYVLITEQGSELPELTEATQFPSLFDYTPYVTNARAEALAAVKKVDTNTALLNVPEGLEKTPEDLTEAVNLLEHAVANLTEYSKSCCLAVEALAKTHTIAVEYFALAQQQINFVAYGTPFDCPSDFLPSEQLYIKHFLQLNPEPSETKKKKNKD